MVILLLNEDQICLINMVIFLLNEDQICLFVIITFIIIKSLEIATLILSHQYVSNLSHRKDKLNYLHCNYLSKLINHLQFRCLLRIYCECLVYKYKYQGSILHAVSFLLFLPCYV